MAQRRMFSLSVIDSDSFLNMSLSAQALYFHLGMRSDDDGIINKVNTIQRTINASPQDIDELISNGFIIPFMSGVYAITHWKLNNYIQSDRYHPTIFQEEFNQLTANSMGAYCLTESTDTPCIQSVSDMYPEDSIVKNSPIKDSIVKDNQVESSIANDSISYEQSVNMEMPKAYSITDKEFEDKRQQGLNMLNSYK